jgi:two-component system, LuxR family, sensor kinase FixL
MQTRARWTLRRTTWVSRYGIAIPSVGAALLLTLALGRPEIRGPLFVPAILICAWYGGLGPGLFAAALSVFAIDFFLIPPRYTLHALTVDDATYLLVFALSALVVAWLTGAGRRAEEEVRRQASLLDLTHDSIFVRDANDVITLWNRGAEERYGWSRAEALGKSSHELMKTIFPLPLAHIEAELARTGHWEGELIHTRRDGSKVVVASRWSLQRDEQGRPVGVLETNNDITEQRRTAAALDETRSALAHVSRVTMLGEITASIAHEVNQPLAAVMMNGNAARRWLATDPPNVDEARQALQRIVDDANRAGQVISRIRGLLQRGTPHKTTLGINDVIRETLAFTRSELDRQRVVVHTDLRDDLPPVEGDRVQLQQVLVNLILNAIDSMDGTTLESRALTIRSRHDDDGDVVVEVADRGKGLEPGQHERIFDPFYSTKPGGLGMGLAISRSIIETHGGRIWATPNDGPGLSIQFSLPAGEQAVLRK